MLTSLLPQPREMSLSEGRWTFTDATRIDFQPDCEPARWAAERLRERLVGPTGLALPAEPCAESQPRSGQLLITTAGASPEMPDEAYRLDLQPDRALLQARDPQGLLRGAATLWQLLPAELGAAEATGLTASLPTGSLEDRPQLAWRGLHFDVCRHFYPVEHVKRTIDLCWQFKLNRFHWHLTEDQGWRIEIRRYPKLTEVGAWRGTNANTYGGFYTQEEVRDVVDYARRRGIVVVPEIELPGHAMAALAAYPELSCTGGPFDVECLWGITPDVFCAGKDEVVTFLNNVFEEVLELFDSPWIHLGADECPKDRWKDCPACQKRIAEQGLADEYALQAWLVRQIAEYLGRQGRTVVGWDEIMEGDPPAENLIIEAWRGRTDQIDETHGTPVHQAVRKGYRCINALNAANYFNYDLGRLDLKTAYEFQTLPEDLTPEEQRLIIGGECCLWTEFIMASGSGSTAEVMLLPRMLAVAQRLWSDNDEPFEDFYGRAAEQSDRLRTAGFNVGPAMPCGLEPPRKR